MGLSCVELPNFTGSDNFHSICHGHGLVEALPKGISHERPRCGMMSAGPYVDFSEEAPAFMNGDAAQEDS